MKTESRLHLTLTIPQARAMVDALDIYMRLGLGQVHMVSEMVADGAIPDQLKADVTGAVVGSPLFLHKASQKELSA